MSLCDLCRDPGACCRNFPLSVGIPKGATHTEAEKLLQEKGGVLYAPFIAVAVDPVQKPGQRLEGHESWRWACRALTGDGRCSVYLDRPTCCAVFEPLSDDLCVMRADDLTPEEQAAHIASVPSD